MVALLILGLLCASGLRLSGPPSVQSTGRQLISAGTADVPKIVSQRDGGPGRVMIEVENPLDQSVSVFIECPSGPMTVPFTLARHTRASVNVPSSTPRCLIRRFISESNTDRPSASSRSTEPSTAHKGKLTQKLEPVRGATAACRSGPCAEPAVQRIEPRARRRKGERDEAR